MKELTNILEVEVLVEVVKSNRQFQEIVRDTLNDWNSDIEFAQIGSSALIPVCEYVEGLVVEYVNNFFNEGCFWEFELEEYIEYSLNQELHENVEFFNAQRVLIEYE